MCKPVSFFCEGICNAMVAATQAAATPAAVATAAAKVTAEAAEALLALMTSFLGQLLQGLPLMRLETQ